MPSRDAVREQFKATQAALLFHAVTMEGSIDYHIASWLTGYPEGGSVSTTLRSLFIKGELLPRLTSAVKIEVFTSLLKTELHGHDELVEKAVREARKFNENRNLLTHGFLGERDGEASISVAKRDGLKYVAVTNESLKAMERQAMDASMAMFNDEMALQEQTKAETE